MPRLKPAGFIQQMADQAKWGPYAACQDDDPVIFDTVSYATVAAIDDTVQVAMDVCADCPVMMACLEHAIRFSVEDGVWGGMVHEQRLIWALQHHPEWMSSADRRKAVVLSTRAHAA